MAILSPGWIFRTWSSVLPVSYPFSQMPSLMNRGVWSSSLQLAPTNQLILPRFGGHPC